MIRTVLTVSFLALCGSASAECWVVANLSGQSAKAFDGYRVSADGLSGKTFNVTFNGTASSVEPSNGMSCTQLASRLLVCTGRDGSSVTTETWSLDTSLGKALYTQVRSGYGPLDGNTLYVGEVLSKCR